MSHRHLVHLWGGKMKNMTRVVPLVLAVVCCAGIYAQNSIWRVNQRLSESWGYTWVDDEPGNWAFHSTELEETLHYQQDYPELVDHISYRKKQIGLGYDGLWHELDTIYCNPTITFTATGKTITYDIPTGGYNFQREEVYDQLDRLISLDHKEVNYGYLHGHHSFFYYGIGDRVDSLITRTYSFAASSWEKQIMSYDAGGSKTGDLVLSSPDSLNWQASKRAIIYQSGEDFPPDYKFQMNHMLFDLSPQGYYPTVLYEWIPGLTDCGIVDSLYTEEYVDGSWITRSWDDYYVYTNTNGSIGYTIYSWDPDMIDVVDYLPSCWAFGFDSLGHYLGHSFDQDDGLSPPSHSGTGYTWASVSGALDPAENPVLSIGIKTWPNPFRDEVQVRLEIPDVRAETGIGIYNLKGQKVYGQDGVGNEWMWNGKDFAGQDLGAGIYFIRAENSGLWTVKKVLMY